MSVDTQTRERIECLSDLWRRDPCFDEHTREQVSALSEDELFDAFYTDLTFGTAGLRGILGVGTNRMNIYVVRKAAQALCDAIRHEGNEGCARGVVIAYDSRHCSALFARETARVLAANGVRSYGFSGIRPTPQLSFAVRHLNCIAGVMITASHNPKEYNGFKVYWEDGSQVGLDKAELITRLRDENKDWRVSVPVGDGWEKIWHTIVDEDVDAAYYNAVSDTMLQPVLSRDRGGDLSVVYTPLHGAGLVPTLYMLQHAGFVNVHVVEEQAQPDGDFPTVLAPNPEDHRTLELALGLAERQSADLVLASDPDGDRVIAATRDKDGSYRVFTGNQMGALLLHYIIEQRRASNTLPANAVAVKSIVSSDLAEVVASSNGVQMRNVHVGFRFIGEEILSMEQSELGTFLFGFEESLGFLAGTYTRDKDAVATAVLLCEAALYYKVTKGIGLGEVLDAVFEQYGYYVDITTSVELAGIQGLRTIESISERLRSNPPTSLGGVHVTVCEDYLTQTASNLLDGTEKPIELPANDVLRFLLEGGGTVSARRSGTEPKMKFYYSLPCTSKEEGFDLHDMIEKDLFSRLPDLLDKPEPD